MESKPELRVKSKRPLILRKADMTILNSNGSAPSTFSFYREDVLHDTTDFYFLKGEYQRMILVNRFNIVNKSSRTVAKYFAEDGSVLEKTSDRVTQVIGQEEYKTVFTALCSIIDQELKVRSILALLTVKATESNTDTIKTDTEPKNFTEKSCQTDEMRIELKTKPQRRIRKQVGPYIVSDFKVPEKKVKKVVVNFTKKFDSNTDNSTLPAETDILSVASNNLENNLNTANSTIKSENIFQSNIENNCNTDKIQQKRNSTETLQDLGYLHDDYSNDSLGKLSALSETTTIPELLTNPTSIFDNVDLHTKETYVQDFIVQHRYRINGTDINVPYKPEDIFHIATKDNLQHLDMENKLKLLRHQMAIDKKHCLTIVDENGNYPIHLAVLNKDLELLNRQCVVLKTRGSSVDLVTTGNGLTPLKLAVYQEPPHNVSLASCLLRHGADPLRVDADHRAAVHVAAERDADLLGVVLNTCQENARRILSESEELWKPEMESESDEKLATLLMKHICSTFDKQGYSPLMLASMLGLYENVRILLEHSPASVNDKMPTSGNTALYLAVSAATNASAESGNKSKVLDHFRKTIEVLIEYGADHTIDNHWGTSVNSLLQESDCAELCMLVAHKLTENFTKEDFPGEKTVEVMLVKDKQGNVACKKLENGRKNKSQNKKPNTIDNKKVKSKPKSATSKNKPVIVENILLSPGDTEKNSIIPGKCPSVSRVIDESTKISDRVKAEQKKRKIFFVHESTKISDGVDPGQKKRKIIFLPALPSPRGPQK